MNIITIKTHCKQGERIVKMTTEIAKRPVDVIKTMLYSESVQEQFHNALKENKDSFVASIIDIYANDNYLQKCEPKLVIYECLKAATLKLPINKSLGYVYIVPYKDKPQMQIGYKGYIQLAMRTNQYETINAGVICEGVTVERDILSGSIKFTGEAKSDKAIGYFAYFKLLNGFSKTLYMTEEEVIAHAKRYSRSFNQEGGAWKNNFEQMAIKTPLRALLSRYGIMSTEMQRAVDNEEEVADEIQNNANKGDFIDAEIVADKTTGEITESVARAETVEKCCVCGKSGIKLTATQHGDLFCDDCGTGKVKSAGDPGF